MLLAQAQTLQTLSFMGFVRVAWYHGKMYSRRLVSCWELIELLEWKYTENWCKQVYSMLLISLALYKLKSSQ